MQAPTTGTDAQPLQTSGLAEVVRTKALRFHENEGAKAAKRKASWAHQQIDKTRLRRDEWPVGGGGTFILHGLHLQIFPISFHICAGVNLSLTFLLRPRAL